MRCFFFTKYSNNAKFVHRLIQLKQRNPVTDYKHNGAEDWITAHSDRASYYSYGVKPIHIRFSRFFFSNDILFIQTSFSSQFDSIRLRKV